MNRTIKHWIEKDIQNLRKYGDERYCSSCDAFVEVWFYSKIVTVRGYLSDRICEGEEITYPVAEMLTNVQLDVIKRCADVESFVTRWNDDFTRFRIHDEVNVEMFLRKLLSFLRTGPRPNITKEPEIVEFEINEDDLWLMI